VPVLSLSIGSNVNPEANIRRACELLCERFGKLRYSAVYESEAVGFSGENFLNLAVLLESDLPLADIKDFLKELEDSMGRDRSKPRFSERVIDIDILTFGDSDGSEANMALPREEITRNAYVLCPLSELLPEELHPPSGKSYAQLWQEYDKSAQSLWCRDFEFTK